MAEPLHDHCSLENFGQSLVDEAPNTVGQTIGNLIGSQEEQASQSGSGSENPLQALFGGIEKVGSAIIGGVEQVGGAIINGVEQVGGAIVSGVETVGNDVVQGVEGLFAGDQAAPTEAGGVRRDRLGAGDNK